MISIRIFILFRCMLYRFCCCFFLHGRVGCLQSSGAIVLSNMKVWVRPCVEEVYEYMVYDDIQFEAEAVAFSNGGGLAYSKDVVDPCHLVAVYINIMLDTV